MKNSDRSLPFDLRHKLDRLSDRIAYRLSSYRPVYNTDVNLDDLQAQAAEFFNLPEKEVAAWFQSYHKYYSAQGYESRLGEARTLSLEEAFLIFLSLERTRPKTVVEIGTQHGKSTRRILDMLTFLQIPARMICFDIFDGLQFVTHEDVELRLHDVTDDFRSSVLETLRPELIYLDAHPYYLLRNVISSFLDWTRANRSIMAIHDCTPGLYNSKMYIPKGQPERISSRTGVWERHTLAEIFSVPERALDDVHTPTHRLRVFGTRHGLALLAPQTLLNQEYR